MSPALALALLLHAAPSQAAWPEDVSLEAMTDHGGSRVSGDLHDEYLELVEELGTVVGSQPLVPAGTLGALGFDVSLSTTFVLVTPPSDDETPSIWQRAHEDEEQSRYLVVPRIGIRKGLPLSLEAGLDAAWLGLTRQGVLSGYGRVAVVEGYKPWPDVTIQVGYAGYVGNDELDLGVLDMGVTLGSTYAFGSIPGIRTAQWSPYLGYRSLRVTANPTIDPEIEATYGFTTLAASPGDDEEPAPLLHQLGAGFQITNGTLTMKLAGSWVPGSVPGVTVGMGFTY